MHLSYCKLYPKKFFELQSMEEMKKQILVWLHLFFLYHSLLWFSASACLLFFSVSVYVCVSVYNSDCVCVCVSLMCCQNVFVLFAIANFIFCSTIFSSLSLCPPYLCAWHRNKLKPNRIKKNAIK